MKIKSIVGAVLLMVAAVGVSTSAIAGGGHGYGGHGYGGHGYGGHGYGGHGYGGHGYSGHHVGVVTYTVDDVFIGIHL